MPFPLRVGLCGLLGLAGCYQEHGLDGLDPPRDAIDVPLPIDDDRPSAVPADDASVSDTGVLVPGDSDPGDPIQVTVAGTISYYQGAFHSPEGPIAGAFASFWTKSAEVEDPSECERLTLGGCEFFRCVEELPPAEPLEGLPVQSIRATLDAATFELPETEFGTRTVFSLPTLGTGATVLFDVEGLGEVPSFSSSITVGDLVRVNELASGEPIQVGHDRPLTLTWSPTPHGEEVLTSMTATYTGDFTYVGVSCAFDGASGVGDVPAEGFAFVRGSSSVELTTFAQSRARRVERFANLEVEITAVRIDGLGLPTAVFLE